MSKRDEAALRHALYALRHPRGRYSADRASQLSGVPVSTVYDWQRNDIYVPDLAAGHPMAWSYRDLVYLRLLAWLRQQRMQRPTAADKVRRLKRHVERGGEVQVIRADDRTFLVDDEPVGRFDGSTVLFASLLDSFDLLATVEELGQGRLWGPNLVAPSEHTYISPWVLGGDPCIDESRIPTSAVFALREERGLDTAAIVELYPGLRSEAADDAYLLERRLRGVHEAPAA